MPVFEKFNSGAKQKLIEELENENDESKFDSMILDQGNNGLNIVNAKKTPSNGSNEMKKFESCKC